MSPKVSPLLILYPLEENLLKSKPYLKLGFLTYMSFISTGFGIFFSFLQQRMVATKKRDIILKRQSLITFQISESFQPLFQIKIMTY